MLWRPKQIDTTYHTMMDTDWMVMFKESALTLVKWLEDTAKDKKSSPVYL